MGNKLDLTDKRIVKKEDVENYAEEHKLPYIETSAKEGINIDELFNNSITKFLSGIHDQSNEKNIKLKSEKKKKKGCC